MLEALKTFADEQLVKYDLESEGWKIVWDADRSFAGACDRRRKRILLSHFLLEKATDEEGRETVLHEIAHALNSTNQHDDEWIAKLIEIGGTGSEWVAP